MDLGRFERIDWDDEDDEDGNLAHCLRHWTVVFDVSWKRGDWLRPVTGWRAKPAEIREWERATKQRWRRHG